MEEPLKIAIARIETKLDSILDNQQDHEKRLRLLEGKSGRRWEALIGQAISAVAAAACGMLLGRSI